MSTNGNGLVSKTIITAAISGFCGLCVLGFFNVSSRVDANGSDHLAIRQEAVKRVEDRNQLLRELINQNSGEHSEICQRLARIEALLK